MTALHRHWPGLYDYESSRTGHGTPTSWCSASARQCVSPQCPGFYWPVCEVWIEPALDVHMSNVHLEMAQLWRYPVEWCAVWKGLGPSLSGSLVGEAWGSSLFGLKNVFKFPPPPPPWTVSRHIWQTALRPDVSGVAVDARLFHEAACRLVHRYRVYKDLFPHPALREGVIPRLLSCVCRAMAIARLTHLRIYIPRVGSATWPCTR